MANRKVSAVHLDLTDYSHPTDALGNITFFRDKPHKLTASYRLTAHRVPRALEAQRLFLAQLEKEGRGK